MSDVPPDPVSDAQQSDRQLAESQRHEREEGPEPALMPGWVPALVGSILILLAGLAVYTGLRFRQNNVTGHMIHPKTRVKPMATAPPGEPGPGASLVFPGDSTDNTPAAREPVAGQARAQITGGGAGVSGVLRLWVRRGMIVNVVPDDAMVYVNDVAVGQARQFNTPDEGYDFPAAGSYNVRVTASGYKDRSFVVTAAENAKDEVARLDARLEKQ